MDPINVGSLIVAAIAAFSAWASQRSAAKASMTNARIDVEKEAYIRARSHDTETIKNQKAAIDELRRDNEVLREANDLLHDSVRQIKVANEKLTDDNRTLHIEVRTLRRRIARLERGISPDNEEPIRERIDDEYPVPERPVL